MAHLKRITEERLAELLQPGTSPESIDKRTEIAILNYLGRTPSYFANQFSTPENWKMISNISNDFPLLHGTLLSAEIDELRTKEENCRQRIVKLDDQVQALLDLSDQHEETINNLNARIDRILKEMIFEDAERAQGITEPLTALANCFEIQDIIRKKIDMNIDLTKVELDFVKNNLK